MVKVAIFMSIGHLYPFLYSEDVGSRLFRNVSETIRCQILIKYSTQRMGAYLIFLSSLYLLLFCTHY
jgi:hypothetical protein